MKASQKERVNALHRVQYFLDQHGDAVGPVNQSRTRFALDDVVKQLGARAADQLMKHRAARLTILLRPHRVRGLRLASSGVRWSVPEVRVLVAAAP